MREANGVATSAIDVDLVHVSPKPKATEHGGKQSSNLPKTVSSDTKTSLQRQTFNGLKLLYFRALVFAIIRYSVNKSLVRRERKERKDYVRCATRQ